VLAKSIQTEGLCGIVQHSIGTNLSVAAAGCPGRNLGMKPLPVAHHGCEKAQGAASTGLPDEVADQFVASLRLHGHLTVGAVLRSDLGVEQADEMMHLRYCCHRALAASATRVLLDTHRGRQPGDAIHLGSRHLLHDLPGIGSHGIQEAALPFIEQDIKRERALTRPTDAGDHHKPGSWNIERQVPQVVLARTLHVDGGWILPLHRQSLRGVGASDGVRG
jgi:hypothetical protein